MSEVCTASFTIGLLLLEEQGLPMSPTGVPLTVVPLGSRRCWQSYLELLGLGILALEREAVRSLEEANGRNSQTDTMKILWPGSAVR